MIASKRITDPTYIDRVLIEGNLRAGQVVTVQFSERLYSAEMLAVLNELSFEFDERFGVRFFGHYQARFDCRTLLHIPNVKSLWVDCLQKADNQECLTELKYLTRLGLGIFELTETEILEADNFRNLSQLFIGDAKTKAFNLEYLKHYRQLKNLTISGHKKNIDAVGELVDLEHLHLWSLTKHKLDFVNNLKRLTSLHIMLGGREDIIEIEDNQIETLQITRVRGFSNFENVSRFKGLKSLLVEDQIQLRSLHFDKEISTLEDLKLLNCKSFNSLTGLEKLSSLTQLRIFKSAIDFDGFMKQSLPQSLNILAFYTNKAKDDKEIKEKLLKLGYRDGLER